MFPSLRPSRFADAPALVLLVFVAMAAQRSVVRAQYSSPVSSSYPYYFWLTPGRIAGIAVGVIVLILIILGMFIVGCRRRRRAKASSNVMVPNYPGGQPQAYPSWREGQQPVPTPYGPDTTNVGWYYPATRTTPSNRGRNVASTGQAQRTVPPDRMPSPTPLLGEVERTPPSDQVQRPAPKSPVQRPVPTSPMQRPTATSPVQRPAQTSPVLSTTTTGRMQRTASSGHPQGIAFPGQVQSAVPFGQVERTAPPSQVESTPPVRAQEQVVPLPHRNADTKGTLSPGEQNGREPSPPPYYPPTAPTTPPAEQTAR